MKLTFPTILTKCRSEHGKQIRRLYKNDVGVPYQEAKGYAPRMDGCCNTITTFTCDNNIIYLNDMKTRPEYKPSPTKEDLRDYFAPRVMVRKMVPRESFRLMSVPEEDIDKLFAWPFKTLEERRQAIEHADKKELQRIKRESISKTAMFRLAGNSIVTDCLYWLFFKLFIDTSNPNKKPAIREYTIFDYC